MNKRNIHSNKKRFTGKQIGIVVGLCIAAAIFFLPARENVKIEPTRETVQPDHALEAKQDSLAPKLLLDWIIEGRTGYKLIDIRSATQFQKSHIKGAENIPMKQFFKDNVFKDFPQDTQIILYGYKSDSAIQAWLALKKAGFSVYLLSGGFQHWDDTYLNPKMPGPDATDEEIQQYKTCAALKNYFEGKGDAAGVAVELPEKARVAPRKPRKKKKKLGGC